MTTPVFEFVKSYVLAPNGTGNQFLRTVAPVTSPSYQVPIPVGVNTVQITVSCASHVVVAFYQGGESLGRPSRLQIPAGDGTRTAVSDLPVSEEGAYLQLTAPRVQAGEEGQPVCGVKIFPAPPTT